MIPIELTIQGLYSYQEKQTIDFRKLTDANLFGIFGHVGSGKSSLLEAIIFALYGKTDRLNSSGDNRNYNMMNLKSDKLLIDFQFSVSEKNYRTIVKGRRNSKRYEDVNKFDHTAFEKNGDDWLPISLNAVLEAVGLDYNNFKRAVIIPQGRFQEFLQLSSSQRTNMMKELFSLEKYELSTNTQLLEKANDEKLRHLEGQLAQVGEIDPKEIEEDAKKIVVLENELKERTQLVLKKQHTEKLLNALQKLVEKKELLLLEANKLNLSKESIIQKEKNIQHYNFCFKNFKQQIEKEADFIKNIAEVSQKLKTVTLAHKNYSDEYEKINRRFEVLSATYENRDQIKREAEELGKLITIRQLQKNGEAAQKRFSLGEDHCKKEKLLITEYHQQKKELEKSIKQLNEKMPNSLMLAEAKAWHSNLNIIVKRVKEIEQLLETLRKKASNHINNLKVLDSSHIDNKLVIKDIIINKKKNIEALEAKISEARDNHNLILLRLKLEELVNNLEENAPCPLCGSMSHPDIMQLANVEKEILISNEQISTIQQNIQRQRQQLEKIQLVATQLSEVEKQTESAMLQLNDVQVQLNSHRKLFIWKGYEDINSVTNAFAEAAQMQRELKIKEKAKEEIESKQTRSEKNLEKYNNELAVITEQITSFNVERKTLLSQLQHINYMEYDAISESDIKNLEQKGLSKYNSIVTEYQSIKSTISALDQKIHTLTGQISSYTENRDGLINEKNSCSAQLEEKIARSEYQSRDEISVILKQEKNIDQEQRIVNEFHNAQLKNQSLLSLTEKEIGERVYSKTEHQDLVTNILELNEQNSIQSRELGRLQALLKKKESDRKLFLEIRKAYEKLEIRRDNLMLLKQLFRGSGFVNFVSSVHLQQLCNSANDRFFKLTNQNMSLELSKTNDFLVRDYMNGGKVRSIKTLSGGQTFQAALSLALALSDSVQTISGSAQNFFFLDEGFGALDREALQTVFKTLKSLRSENRIVGVISHVDEMQQEIDVNINVSNDPQRGSLLTFSWMQ